MANEALLLGAGGGLLGLAGGFLQASQAKKQQSKFSRRQRKAVREARSFTEQRLEELIGEGTLFAEGVDFLRGTFGEAGSSPLAQDFVKQIRAAQAARGTFSGAGAAAAEAGGLAAFSQDLRARLLPQLQAFSFAPEQLRQSILGFEAPLRVSARTGAPIPGTQQPLATPDPFSTALNSAISGFAGGAQVGLGFENLNLQRESLAAKQQQTQALLAALQQQQGGGQLAPPTILDQFGGPRGNILDLLQLGI